MKIAFATESFRNECNNQELLVKRYGPQRAKVLRQRLDELFNADVLEDLRTMPHVTLVEPPQGRRGGDLAIDLGHPWRLAFRPGAAPAADGGWDWKKIDSIIILGLVHGAEK